MYTSAMVNNDSTLSNAKRWGKPEFGNAESGSELKKQITGRDPIALDLSAAFEEVDAKLNEAMKPFDRLPNSEQNQQAKVELDSLSAVVKDVCGKENIKDNEFRAETPAVSAGKPSMTVSNDNSDGTADVVRSFGM